MHPNENNPQPENEIDVSWLLSLISQAKKEAQRIADQIARGKGGREIALCITKLEEANHRAVDALVLLNEQPIENQEK